MNSISLICIIDYTELILSTYVSTFSYSGRKEIDLHKNQYTKSRMWLNFSQFKNHRCGGGGCFFFSDIAGAGFSVEGGEYSTSDGAGSSTGRSVGGVLCW